MPSAAKRTSQSPRSTNRWWAAQSSTPLAVPGAGYPSSMITAGSRVVAYCRISRDREGAGLGVERQAADCRDLAARLGLPEPEVITDNDLSAYSGKRRPGYEVLLAGLREGRWTHLLVWHTDRLHRRPRELEDFVPVIEASGVHVHTVKGGRVDLTTHEGLLQARIFGNLAAYESGHRSDRVKAKLADNAAKGKTNGGPRPYGYGVQTGTVEKVDKKTGETVTRPVFDMTQKNPDEARVVAELIRRVVDGEKVAALARDLRERKEPSARGAAWSSTVVREVVLRPRNGGLVEHRGQIVTDDHGEPVESKVPALVARQTWETARAILTDPARKTSTGNAPTRLLSGIAVCGVCDGPVRAGGARGGVPVYRCSKGEHVKRRVEFVDRIVVGLVKTWLARERIERETFTPTPTNRQKAEAVRLKLERLEDKYADDDISVAGYRRNRARLTAELDELTREEALSHAPDVLEGVTPQSFDALPLERRRAVVDYLCTVRMNRSKPGHSDKESIVVDQRESE